MTTTTERGVSTRRVLDPDALAALEDERDFLLRSLADLEREHEAGDVDHTDYVALKDDYTARAAAVLRSIEQRRTAIADAAPAPSAGRRLAWVAGIVVLAVVAGFLIARASGESPPMSVRARITRSARLVVLWQNCRVVTVHEC